MIMGNDSGLEKWNFLEAVFLDKVLTMPPQIKQSFVKNTVLTFLLSCFFFCCSTYAQDKLYRNTFSLTDVTLLDGPFKHARDLNIQTLLKYDVDRLLAGYRKEAGLPAKAKIYSNWDGLDGHVG
jgi:hypothetical protein